MIDYRNILVAVDFSPSADEVIKRATALKQSGDVKLTILHVVDHLPPLGFGEEPLIAPDWMIPEKELLDSARKSMDSLLKQHHLNSAEHLVTLGTASNEIVRVADEKNTDLIVLGSHGRHGARLLLGSTANGVLHHANCDVLAVRIKEQE
jgi:universal stress protein A